jgi:hypothetical protein
MPTKWFSAHVPFLDHIPPYIKTYACNEVYLLCGLWSRLLLLLRNALCTIYFGVLFNAVAYFVMCYDHLNRSVAEFPTVLLISAVDQMICL